MADDVAIDPRAADYYPASGDLAVDVIRERVQEWDYEADPHGYCHERAYLVALLDRLDRAEETLRIASRRISSAEREAGRTQDQHMRSWLPEVKDRVLHPYPRPAQYDRAAVIRVFNEIEAEIAVRAANRGDAP